MLALANAGVVGSNQTSTGFTPLHFEIHRTLSGNAPITGVTWSPDGGFLATIGDFGQLITIWDADGNAVRQLKRNGPYYRNSISFVSKGREILAPADSKPGPQVAFTLWNVESGAIVRNVEGPALEGRSRRNTAEIFDHSPDAHAVVAIATLAREPITLYSTVDWKIRRSFPMNVQFDRPASVAISKKGDQLAVGSFRGNVTFITLTSQAEPPKTILAYPQPPIIGVNAVAFSPDGKFLATGADAQVGAPSSSNVRNDEPHKPIKIWRLNDHQLAVSYVTAEIITPIRQLSWSPDSRYLAAAANDNSVRFFAPGESSQEIVAFRPDAQGVRSVSFSPDGSLVAVAAGNTVTILKLKG